MNKALKRSISALLLIALTSVSFGCRSSPITTSSFDGGTGIPCTTFADWIVSYTQGGNLNENGVAQAALGEPDDVSVLISKDTVLTVIFTGLGAVIDMPNNDIRIHNSIDNDAKIAVYAGNAPDDIPYCGEISQFNRDIDLDTGSVSSATYIQLVGLSGTAMIDAVESLQTLCPNQ